MKEKSKNGIIIVLVLIIIFCVVGIFFFKQSRNLDGKKFEEEYESLNGKTTGTKDKKYMSIDIDEDNPIVYKDLEGVLDILENGTGVIYFGFPECPWCRNLVPVLMDALEESEYKGNVYYCNALNDRDKKHLDDHGNVVVDEKGSRAYYKLVETLNHYLSVYDGLEDDTIKRLYFPTVVFVKNGEVVDFHEDTVTSQEDPYVKLNDDQYEELLNILVSGIKKVQGILCTDDSKC